LIIELIYDVSLFAINYMQLYARQRVWGSLYLTIYMQFCIYTEY